MYNVSRPGCGYRFMQQKHFGYGWRKIVIAADFCVH